MITTLQSFCFTLRAAFWKLLNSGRVAFNGKVYLYENLKLAVQPEGKLTLGEGVSLQKGVVISVGANAKVELGAQSYLGEYTVVMAKLGISIGPGVMIAPHCVFADYEHDFQDASRPMTPEKFSSRPITVEENAWIGAGVKVLEGVTIGKGAVIGAGSVVNRDIPAYTIAAGVPVKIIGTRDKALTP